MKKILIIFIFIVSSYFIYSDSKIDKIAIININEIMDAVFSGKSPVMQSIKDEKKEMQDNLTKLKENILKLEDAKSKDKDEAKKLAYEKKIDELKKQYADYYKLRSYQIDQKVKNIQEPMFKEIFNVVKKIAETEGYTVVLEAKTDGLFYYSIDNDITSKVIDKFKNDK
jgi:outer membrane protein